ncbi:MAG: hypothetical protein AMXMBFR25_17650 [Lysobacterales bacterium]|nr:hypothetical protein [Xanthomonadales bacterium]
MSGFVLDSRLARDSELLEVIDAIEVRMMLRVPWPWLLLVPRADGAVEPFDLDVRMRNRLWQLTLETGAALKTATGADKINLGALGNIVSQLHVHVVARHRDDPAWPQPVWGCRVPVPAEAEERVRIETLRALAAQIARSMPGRASVASQP